LGFAVATEVSEEVGGILEVLTVLANGKEKSIRKIV
jgi:hypothetical protein